MKATDRTEVQEERHASAQDERAPGALLADLNAPQREAVTLGGGPLLILAGAGTGKTRVITRRIAWLVATGRARPDEVLAITFTNKAAREMRARVEALLDARGMWLGTFHATCARILRREIDVLSGFTRDFTIYDTQDRNDLLKKLVQGLGYDTQRFRPGLLGAWISAAKNRGFARGAGRMDGIEDEVLARVSAAYDEAMRTSNALDFDDLLVKTVELFDARPGIRDSYAHRFRHVLVDEYQDTNRVQYLLTRHLALRHGNLTVCGDPDQSIYAWRGADIRNILDFEADFVAEGGSVAVVKLEENYRSTPSILAAAQALIRHNKGRKEKELWTRKPDVEALRVIECGSEDDEAGEIVARIRGLLAKGVDHDQVAIFYRVNWMQRALERALRLSGVPYQIVGGVEFYQRREVRDLVAYLQLIVNPKDDVAFERVVNAPMRGVGDKTIDDLRRFAADRRISMLGAAGSSEFQSQVKGRARKGLAAFAGLHARLVDLREKPAAMALDCVIEETDYFGWLSALGEDDAEGRAENVEELRTHASAFDAENEGAGVRGFLQDVALTSDADGYDEDVPRVALMTLHSSKGLEFPAVFVAGLEEELLPHALALADSSTPEAAVEEERRLFYVGMTRAKERLVLTHARTRMHYGETSWRSPSRFLAELPRDHVVAGVEADASEEEESERNVLGAYAAPALAPELREGDRVQHAHFGTGRIERMQGSGPNARVTVDFREAGTRILLVQYAKLTVLSR